LSASAFFEQPVAMKPAFRVATLEDLPTTAAARATGFRALELGSTLPGVALYEACGFREVERVSQPMPGGLSLPIVRMRREMQ
jgi:hypothetical protein